MARPRLHHERLPCGLELLLRESRLAPVAEVQIWARVGSADERDGERGLAHFHEHMLFKGTERRGVGEVAGDVEALGGRINAYTSYDVTVYHATVPGDAAPVALDVLVDALRHSVFDPAEIEREIEVVLEEIRRSEDSPLHVVGDLLFADAFRVHPYRWPILGSAKSVASFNREKVQAFFRRWYAPGNLLVVACGDFDAETMAAAVRDAFADAPAGGPPHARAAEPPQQALRASVTRRDFERAFLDVAWRSVPLAHDDTPYLDLLAFVLGEGESSRLVRRVKEHAGLVDQIDASSYTPLDPGLFGVTASLDSERAEAALEAIVRQTERLRFEPVSAEELDKARTNFLASEHFERESVAGQASKLGSFEVLAGDWRREQAYLEAIVRATPQDLLRVARAHLGPERLTVAALLPPEAAPRFDAETVAAAATRASEQARRRVVPVPARRPCPELHSFVLDNGIELHVEPRREVPVVAARAAFLGGLLSEEEKTAGLTSFLTSMWLRGTGGRSAAELARAIESIAADLDGFSGRSSLGLALEVPSEKLDPALDLFAEVLLDPSFAPDEIERERRDVLAAIARREDRLAARAVDLFAEAHWRSHPYRLPLLGTETTVARFGREDLLAHHARLVRARNLVVAVAGDVEPEAIAERLAGLLGGLDGDAFEPPAPPLEPSPREVREVELRKDRAQAHLVIGFRGLTVQDPDRAPLDVISQLLAGQAGRLFLELRDRRGLAYSVNAVNVEGMAPGFFAVTIATAPEKLDDARSGMFAELEKLLDAAPGEADVERARRYLIGNHAIDRQRNAARAAQSALDARYGLGPDAAARYPAQVRAVTRDDVLRVARRVIDLSAYTSALIRP